MDFLTDKTILITGGTGSFGFAFTEFLLKNTKVKKIIIFSRDEFKQSKMNDKLGRDERLRFFIGDVRDLPRLNRAFCNVDIVVHSAALKQVPTLEYNPFEAVKTNILGSQNVIEAAIDQCVKKVILVSTDKAVEPINLYGSTKLCAEKLFVSGNSYAGGKTVFSCVRYGNVVGSRGSIIEILTRQKDKESFDITDRRMSRFWIPIGKSIQLVLFALENMVGGEIFVPKIPSMKLVDLFEALAPNAKLNQIGVRPGEKIHEVLVSKAESPHSIELTGCFVILSEFPYFSASAYNKYYKEGKKLPENFEYSSNSNTEWMTKDEIISMSSDYNSVGN